MYDDQYLLDVNPNSKYRTYRDNVNVIDARFIDTYTGIYMDITALTDQSVGYSMEPKKNLNCKSPHWYALEDIFPLKATVIHDVAVWRPNDPIQILKQEYSLNSMSNRIYKDFKFTDNNLWV